MNTTEIDSLHLNPMLAEYAWTVYGENDIVRKESLETLRDMIRHLPNENDRLQDVSDRNLIRFLRSRKFNLEKSLECTVQYQHFLNQHAVDLAGITKEIKQIILNWWEKEEAKDKQLHRAKLQSLVKLAKASGHAPGIFKGVKELTSDEERVKVLSQK